VAKSCFLGGWARRPGLAAAAILLGHGLTAGAQELEPRRWSHLPVNANYAGAGYAYSGADIYFDPVLGLEDVELDLHTFGAKYLRTFRLMGRSARVDLVAAYQDAKWEGLLSGEPASTTRTGLADPAVRFSVNLLGGPPLQGKEFLEYRAAHPVETLAGAGLSVQLPLGQYYEDRLLNLGENRFTFRPEIGVVHTRRKWSAEVTGLASIYTDNNDFWNGNSREQEPLYVAHGHLVYTFRPGLWAGASAAYGYGGESTINGVAKDDRKSDVAWALSVAYPVSKAVGVKLAYLRMATQESTGADSDTFATAVSMLW
jgi:hypothetical protein